MSLPMSLPRPYPPATYEGDGEASAWLRRAGGEPEIAYPNGVTCEYLATGEQTAERFGLYRWTFGEEETGPGPHFHKTISEQFYVLSGTVTIFDGRGWRDAGPGDFAYVPEGGLHGFRGSAGASMLLMFAPGGPREGYFEGLDALARGEQMGDEELQAFMHLHDTFYV